ncbi:MAG: bifunctional phosphoribosylaminoimidazolecarboxamide formyltransferase/IMP cyclohydrolase [Synergistaceae bacterium]|jgi:phosphoribosylaminoimidazolecarboxamide formyltransferase/IMP cyclohydrolase|nr:bifunctional phosphoribosylaminoimidazolecarboxamide formyltransferase/IMP cyclohydrolase [Synergistaceae bacterium]
MPQCKVKRALLSVSDKKGLVEFARGLTALGVEIVSTGGTHKTLKDAGIPAIYISDVTGFPEILDGRVKTLHPAIHGGILARRNHPEHLETLAEQHITPIDLVAVNLYPFRRYAADPDASWEDLIENIDIGGPSMVRSAAKNHEDVLIVVHPEDYDGVLTRLQTTGDCPKEERVRLAIAAFRHTAEYDACICNSLELRKTTGKPASFFPERVTLTIEKFSGLRYGENPGQAALLCRQAERDGVSFIDSRQLQGKELSYNNWLDADSAFKIIQELGDSDPAAVIVKHTNPCGAAIAGTIEEAFQKAWDSDPVSAFGGILAVNRPIPAKLAKTLAEVFWEVLIAPSWPDETLDILKTKTALRLLEVPSEAWAPVQSPEWRSVQGGFLIQERDLQLSPPESWITVTSREPLDSERRDMEFAWKIVKHVKSNAIVVVKDQATVGIGAGQMNRVGAAEIALKQAGQKARGAVLASDAFFPFGDTVKLAAEYGIAAVIQPGGSLKDQESTDVADEKGIAMLHTGVRHFKH